MKIDKRLRDIAKRNFEMISGSTAFIVLWNEKMIEEVFPLIEMGFAVYLDKPIVILVPGSERHKINQNLSRLARAIETFDDSLPEDEMLMSMQAATMRLMTELDMVKGEP